jgi:hypothetical protein
MVPFATLFKYKKSETEEKCKNVVGTCLTCSLAILVVKGRWNKANIWYWWWWGLGFR